MIAQWIRWWSGPPAFRVYGKTRRETAWRTIDIYATARRNDHSRWPLWRGTCTCWSSNLIAVGWDFARALVDSPGTWAISRDRPLTVAAGRLTDAQRRAEVGAPACPGEAEILAHEIGHTLQALRLRLLYLPLVGAVTIFGEGRHFWNRFENEASDQGQFGGIVPDSVCDFLRRIEPLPLPRIDLSLSLARMGDR